MRNSCGLPAWSGSRGFTLIELLVVVGIIGILAGMLLPGLGRGKEQARITTCLNNMRQLGVGIKLYIDDNNHRFPPVRLPDLDNPLRFKWIEATIGGYDPIPVQAPFWVSSERRPLFPYIKPSEVYRCPTDKGQYPRPCEKDTPPLKPSNFLTIGCSYQYNAGPLTTIKGGGFRNVPADPAYGLATKPESWVPQPELYILMHEPPARLYCCIEVVYWHQWHYLRGKSDILDPIYARKQFVSPILYVDGHAAVHNFSKVLTTDPRYPYEPTKDWIWYKPLEELSALGQ